MKILYVVQRYGDQIVGGSESACRHFAENLVLRGHKVDVLTSCAHDYVDWSDEYTPGYEEINGVGVHRLQVVEPRSSELFGPIHNWLSHRPSSPPLFEQQRWAQLMGPQLQNQREWLLTKAHKYDVVIFMTYLYATTTDGLPTVAGRAPTILQPTAHDEPPAYVSLYQSIFRQPDSFLFFTEEEKSVVERLYNIKPNGSVIGMGIPLNQPRGDGREFRKDFGIGDCPYIIYVGRLDSSKGVGELARFFISYKDRNKSPVKLVLVGDGALEIPQCDDIITVGFLEEHMKRNAIAGSVALVQPSFFESFSIALCEAWLENRPALVQGKSAVLRGQALRSNGAIPYEGFAEFEVSLEFLLSNPAEANSLGFNGRKYVETNYDWSAVLDRMEATIHEAQEQFQQRRWITTPLQ